MWRQRHCRTKFVDSLFCRCGPTHKSTGHRVCDVTTKPLIERRYTRHNGRYSLCLPLYMPAFIGNLKRTSCKQELLLVTLYIKAFLAVWTSTLTRQDTLVVGVENYYGHSLLRFKHLGWLCIISLYFVGHPYIVIYHTLTLMPCIVIVLKCNILYRSSFYTYVLKCNSMTTSIINCRIHVMNNIFLGGARMK